MGHFYCSRSDITDLLESLTGSEIATTAQQDSKLREPASRWIDSVYPSLAPFAPVPAADPTGWLVTQTNHASGDDTVVLSDGTGTPSVGDIIRPQRAGQWSQDYDDLLPADAATRAYRVTGWDALTNTATYEPDAYNDFPQGAPVYFGPPSLVRQACRYYAVGLALQILRRNPLDKLAEAVFAQARELLGIRKGGRIATARPETGMDIDAITVPVIG